MPAGRAVLDLNADLGERDDDDAAADADLIAVISSANVACGGHAGSEITMLQVCRMAFDHGVAIGAQVSYVDRVGFGRRRLDVPAAVLSGQVRDQVEALRAHAASVGADVEYLKPHGALYHAAADDPAVAGAVVAGIARTGLALPVLTRPGGALAEAARAAGIPAYAEAFADRGYAADGRLVSRDHPAALVTDPQEVSARIRRLVDDGVIVSVDGRPVAVRADSLCIHSDTPGAWEIARAARAALESAGVGVAPFAGRSA
ncbi:MAG: 5-oxoprolinase subunit PxpA [bacterium]